VVLRGPGRDVAFVGGIDLCHGRRDDARHLATHGPTDGRSTATTPVARRPARDPRPGRGRLDTTFRQRWIDPRPVDTDNPRPG
jgi:hypothetical protein